MDSDEDSYDNDNVDSGNVSSGDDDFAMEVDINNTKDRQQETEEYPFEVLSTEQILQHMVDCIKDVNTVVEVSFLQFFLIKCLPRRSQIITNFIKVDFLL